MLQPGSKSKDLRFCSDHKTTKVSREIHGTRILTSITLTLLLMVVCFWSSPVKAESVIPPDIAGNQTATFQSVKSNPASDAVAVDIPLASGLATAEIVADPVAPVNTASVIGEAVATRVTADDQTAAVPGSDTTTNPVEQVDPHSAATFASPENSGSILTSTAENGMVATPATVSSTEAEEDDDSDGCPGCNLDLICEFGDPGVYWASHADYLAHLLSIDYQLLNNGPGTAASTHVTSATATNGVTVASPLPDLGTLLPGESIVFTLQWLIPTNVTNFTTSLTVCTECGSDDDDSTIDDDDSSDDDSNDDGTTDDDNSDDDSNDDSTIDDDDSSDDGSSDDGANSDDNDDPGKPDDTNSASEDPGVNDSTDFAISTAPSPTMSQVQSQVAGNSVRASASPSTLPTTGMNIGQITLLAVNMFLAGMILLTIAPAARLNRIKRK